MRNLLIALGLSLVAVPVGAQPGKLDYDVIIANARIVDGSGNPWYRGDIGIRGQRIATIGKLDRAKARRRIDAADRIVTPGFVDMHSHASWSYLADSRALSKVTQGITLEIEGEGFSVAPLSDKVARLLEPEFNRRGVKQRWRSFDEFMRVLEANPGTINWASHIGTGTVRDIVIGTTDRRADDAELQQMCRIVSDAMREGALGVYSALRYPPDLFNRTDELVAMSRVAGAYGGIYYTHQRSEGDGFRQSLQEVFDIARRARVPAHITHLKLIYAHNWGMMGEMTSAMAGARAQGIDITGDLYPYEWAGGSFTNLLPPWVQDGGRIAIVANLQDPAKRARIKQELEKASPDWENEYNGAAGGPAGLRMLSTKAAAFERFSGKTLAEIAESLKQDPRDVMFDIIIAGDADVISLITSEADLRGALRHPWIGFGTDGLAMAADGPFADLETHPRAFGSFPKIFAQYVREEGLLTLEDAVRRATSFATLRHGIRDRGFIKSGYFADLVIFDPKFIQDRATYEKPKEIATGIHYVLVNGGIVIDNGKLTSARPGIAVRGPGHGASEVELMKLCKKD